MLKVILAEAPFYLKQFAPPNFLALQAAIFFTTNFFLTAHILTRSLDMFTLHGLTFSYFLGIWMNSFTALLEKNVKKEGERLKVVKWAFLQGLVYFLVILPANLAALFDVLKFLITEKIPEFFRALYPPQRLLREKPQVYPIVLKPSASVDEEMKMYEGNSRL